MGIAGTVRFLATQRLIGFDVPDTPVFYGADGSFDKGTDWFIDTLRRSKRYLEFGTGGSTYLAAKFGIEFVAVDSDPFFLKSVQKKIRDDGLARPVGQSFHYADIGLTAHWGRPIGPGLNSPRRLAKFRRYSDPPPQSFEGGRAPDLVLVDGRFRVACVLKTLRALRNERGWTIAMDDYGDRPHFHVVSEFAEIDQLVNDRMAVITAAKPVSSELLDSAIRKYETELD
ncbi:hypothetical protein H7I53_02470 [Mycolicibacterium pulveris]|uniref:Class I SAM-dependent methyltransferase n=1 Tax=Mycolicibacterium pulveris TaxID=36813 RepID=A0A7I7UEE3_MYCPV|nr:hypothetical protein [Mycolicibacterium pulveris]MCV6979093.1 hypothetical protein [Mycolicibacterium pulveris]BBY79702.1 hypothetical protein MPUL_08600 [Mycolicibacterium pulveris]